MTTRPFDETTCADAKKLFAERFGAADASLLDFVLANPARARGEPCGLVGYDDKGVCSTVVLLPRRLYWRKQKLKGDVGVALARREDASREAFVEFLGRAFAGETADVFFVNTAIPPSRKRVGEIIQTVDGPASCCELREWPLSPEPGFAARAIARVRSLLGRRDAVPSSTPVCREAVNLGDGFAFEDGVEYFREVSIGNEAFDSFWSDYLATNEGLVSSRTAAELRWMFQDQLASGESILLTLFEKGRLCGYVVCRRTDATAQCWRVADLIAIENDARRLERLLTVAANYLRLRLRVRYFQVTGYPDGIQPLLKKLFPKASPYGWNKCVWQYRNEKARALCGDWMHDGKSWFGCPYDGDMSFS